MNTDLLSEAQIQKGLKLFNEYFLPKFEREIVMPKGPWRNWSAEELALCKQPFYKDEWDADPEKLHPNFYLIPNEELTLENYGDDGVMWLTKDRPEDEIAEDFNACGAKVEPEGIWIFSFWYC